MTSDLQIGLVYEVVYDRDGKGKLFSLIGTYLGKDYANKLLFSLRPVAGNVTLDPSWIKRCRSTSRNVKPQVPQRVAR